MSIFLNDFYFMNNAENYNSILSVEYNNSVMQMKNK